MCTYTTARCAAQGGLPARESHSVPIGSGEGSAKARAAPDTPPPVPSPGATTRPQLLAAPASPARSGAAAQMTFGLAPRDPGRRLPPSSTRSPAATANAPPVTSGAGCLATARGRSLRAPAALGARARALPLAAPAHLLCTPFSLKEIGSENFSREKPRRELRVPSAA